MAHVAFIRDPDRGRRHTWIEGVRGLFADLPATVSGELGAGDAACIWAAGARAPVSHVMAGGGFALLIGYALDDGGARIDVSDLQDHWLRDGEGLHAYDGYYLGTCYDSERGLSVGGDPLGLFPLYWAEPCDGAVVISTTPRALSCHPACAKAIDRVALAAILMMNGLGEDRPLLAGARRVALGHRLWAPRESRCREVEVFGPSAGECVAGETFGGMVERIDHELISAIRRHRPHVDDTLLMLSGGLDSRLIAGCLSDQGIPTRAVSIGRRADHEVRAAVAVAQRLRMSSEVVTSEPDPDTFVSESRRAAQFSGLSAAPSGDGLARGLAAARTAARYAWSGVPFDWLFEPVSRHSGFDIARGTWSLDELVTHVNAWGVPLAKLCGLLGRDGRELLDEVRLGITRRCTQGSLPVDRASALFRWEQRVRSHLANTLHQISFVSWPIMVATDRRLFNALYWLPHAAYPDRKLEKAILGRRRPELAAIPLDSNSFSFRPVDSAAQGVARMVAGSLVRRLRRSIQPLFPGCDVRRYERLFNVDHPQWVAVRRDAERLRPCVEDILDAHALASVWPSPGRRLWSRAPIEGGAAIRLLTGLAYVLEP